ncbi:MAG: hypothetical protein AB7O59_01165 [Pirellulales bacterium]
MKRFLLGVTVLSSVVGLGATAAFFGHDLVAQRAPQVAAVVPGATPARDLSPKPIPLADAAAPAGAANPFAGAGDAAGEVHAVHQVADETQPADAEMAVEDPAAEPQADDQFATEGLPSDIPPADQIDAQDTAPGTRDSYPERTASAQEPADVADPADVDAPAEPRPLSSAPARGSFDRYGRPLPVQAAAPAAAATVEAAQPPAAEGIARQSTEPQVPSAVPIEAGAAEPPAVEPMQDTALPANAAPGTEGSGRPGDPRLSGAQAPTLTIEKVAPPEIQIGKPAKFVIKVRNAGSVDAHGVEVHDVVPQGTQLTSTNPSATHGDGGELVWGLGTLKPGSEQTIELELMPTAEGEIGSVATVHFRAEASVRTIATKPMLEMEVNAPPQVMKGQPVPLKIKISNPGSGAAAGIVLSETVPQGLSHTGGNELEFDVGVLKPGESRELELALTAAEAGNIVNVLTARGEGNLHSEVQTAIEVIAPQLEVAMAGPKRRYLERNATHNISVSNPGTAAAKDIELVAVLPRELQFVSANNNGQFDAATHSVYWSLEELPPQETGTVTLTTLPLQAGNAKVLIKSRAQQDLADEREEVVAIEGIAAINFQLHDASDPIEVNGQTTYEVRVTNQGTKAASNVQLVALLPPEMKPVSADGPVRHHVEAQRVVFEPLKQLAPKAETTFKITGQALQAGDLRLQVQISTDEIRDPITREESTRVYGDE